MHTHTDTRKLNKENQKPHVTHPDILFCVLVYSILVLQTA